jgi:hypothetical protein
MTAASAATERMVHEALAVLRLRRRGPITVLPTGPGRLRRSVLHVPVGNDGGQRFAVVVKHVPSPQPAETHALSWEHQVTRELHDLAETLRSGGAIRHNPLPLVLHEHPLTVRARTRVAAADPDLWVVSIRTYVEATSVMTPRAWGQLIGLLHVIGSTPQALTLLRSRPTSGLFGLDAEHLLRAVRTPGHPHQSDRQLLHRVASVLRQRVAHAIELDPVPLLVHRDLHPLNIVIGTEGPVAIDWAQAGWGNRSDDFAWLHLAITRLGAPPSVLEQARAGYEDIAPGTGPSIEQIRAAGQVRELICLAFSIQNAGHSPAHQRETQIELPILDNPDAVAPSWTPLFNRAAFAHPALGLDERRWAS